MNHNKGWFVWEGCGVDVDSGETIVGPGVGTIVMCGVGTIIRCGVGTIVGDGNWMGVLYPGPVREGCGVDVDGVVAIVGCGVGT